MPIGRRHHRKNRKNYNVMAILTQKEREALGKSPLYSQDGKQGEAVAVVRLFITGTAATYYITEANLETGELFGVSNLEREGFRYGYFYLPELEELSLYGGVVHVEADRAFIPTALKNIPGVARDMADIWKIDD